MDVRWNRPSKAGLRRQRSCGNIEGLARTVEKGSVKGRIVAGWW
jgi:hypothetical protein